MRSIWTNTPQHFFGIAVKKMKNCRKDRKTFHSFKDDMWALGICIEKILGTSADNFLDDQNLKHILKNLKSSEPQNRFEARQLSQYLVQNVFDSAVVKKNTFQTDLAIAADLDKIRRKEAGFKNVFNLLENAFLPQEMPAVTLEERKAPVEKFGEPDLQNW